MHFKNSILVPVVCICLWALAQYFFARPESIVDDWMCWRQADTQTIAGNFLHNGGNILYPQINWGGNGPGYVESEFQLYPFLIAAVMRVTGEAEWPGQVLNILFAAASAFFLYAALCRQFSAGAALIGIGVLLTGRGHVFLSTSVMPDTLSFMFYTLGLFSFLNYTRTCKSQDMLYAVLSTSAAALVKPPALHLGIIQFLILLLTNAKLLRKKIVWCGWIAILTIITLYLLHGRNLYLTYGNTFGILSGGDSKFPGLQHLVMPWLYVKLAFVSVLWGIGIFGAVAGSYLLIFRKIEPVEIALISGNIVFLLLAMRYTSSRWYGPHYHIYTSLLGAWFTAHAVHHIRTKTKFLSGIAKNLLSVILVLLIVAQYGSNLYLRHDPHVPGTGDSKVNTVGYKLSQLVHSNDLVIVRSMTNARVDPFWGTGPDNYEDSRIMYIARVRGWVIPDDTMGYRHIEKYRSLGACYYAEPYQRRDDPELYTWLDKYAQLVFDDAENGRIYRLK